MTLTACNSLTTPSPNNTIPPDLLQACSDLQTLNNTDGASVLKWAIDTVYTYKDCQAKHQGLIDAVK
ncbi:MAG: hypothetical protein IJR46_02505 [Neisseriaceae bacterium]|nr:hypothetical protein [Neisseriaceae bacterium]